MSGERRLDRCAYWRGRGSSRSVGWRKTYPHALVTRIERRIVSRSSVGIGLLGMGVVGGGVVAALHQKRD